MELSSVSTGAGEDEPRTRVYIVAGSARIAMNIARENELCPFDWTYVHSAHQLYGIGHGHTILVHCKSVRVDLPNSALLLGAVKRAKAIGHVEVRIV